MAMQNVNEDCIKKKKCKNRGHKPWTIKMKWKPADIETLNISKNVAIFNNENCSRNSYIFVSISSNNKWKPPLYHWNSLFYLKISPLGCYLARLFSLFNIFFSKNMLFTRAFYTLFIVLWRTGISLVLFYTLTSIKNGRTCFFADFIGRQTNFNWIFNNFEYWKSSIGVFWNCNKIISLHSIFIGKHFW